MFQLKNELFRIKKPVYSFRIKETFKFISFYKRITVPLCTQIILRRRIFKNGKTVRRQTFCFKRRHKIIIILLRIQILIKNPDVVRRVVIIIGAGHHRIGAEKIVRLQTSFLRQTITPARNSLNRHPRVRCRFLRCTGCRPAGKLPDYKPKLRHR